MHGIKKEIPREELRERVALNFDKLTTDPYYSIDEVFSPADYDWYGDKEGRALLAFVCHYKINGSRIPCMDWLIDNLPSHFNDRGYMGEDFGNIIHEQQLSGHSWLLRGLCEYYEQFGDKSVLSIINRIVDNLYLPLSNRISTYPVERDSISDGGVSGNSTGTQSEWILSSDIGCAFMSIDGLSHVYKLTRDEKVKNLLDEMSVFYLGIDKIAIKAQTHCTLTAARGMMRMYECTSEDKYLDGAKTIYDLYVHGGGMTYTYHNLNWWGRPDSWSEPCAVVDSLILALELYKKTNESSYRTVAARIYHNAFSAMQRSNGGAGTEALVCEGSGNTSLKIQLYEAFFCCSMRLAEGLCYINNNRDHLYAELSGCITKDDNGIYSDGDIIYCTAEEGFLHYADDVITLDNLKLFPIIKMWRVPFGVDKEIEMKILF